VVDLDATLGEKLFEVPIGQPVPEVQRTANKITSAGKRNPTNPDGIDTSDRGRRERFIEPPSPPCCDASTQQSPLVVLDDDDEDADGDGDGDGAS